MNRAQSNPAAAILTAPWELIDDQHTIVVSESWDDLEAALLDLPKQSSPSNSIATLIAPSGETLSIGIAGRGDEDNPDLFDPLASVEYTPASRNPPYLIVVGDPSLTFENGGVVVFRFGGQWTEILRRNCVPIDVMVRIVGDFVATGELPGWMDWEEV